MATTINFTKRTLDEIQQANRGERLELKDSKQPGLFASLRPGGSLSFYFYRRIDGRPARRKLGEFPLTTVEQARKAAQSYGGKVAQGIDPQVEKRAKKAEPTLAEAFTYWMDHAKQHKKTWAEDQRQFDKFLAEWRNRKLSGISQADVEALHARIGTKLCNSQKSDSESNYPYHPKSSQPNRPKTIAGA